MNFQRRVRPIALPLLYHPGEGVVIYILESPLLRGVLKVFWAVISLVVWWFMEDIRGAALNFLRVLPVVVAFGLCHHSFDQSSVIPWHNGVFENLAAIVVWAYPWRRLLTVVVTRLHILVGLASVQNFGSSCYDKVFVFWIYFGLLLMLYVVLVHCVWNFSCLWSLLILFLIRPLARWRVGRWGRLFLFFLRFDVYLFVLFFLKCQLSYIWSYYLWVKYFRILDLVLFQSWVISQVQVTRDNVPIFFL